MAKATAPVTPRMTPEQLTDKITKRAKEIFAARMASDTPGDALSDWLQAEKEVKAKAGIKG